MDNQEFNIDDIIAEVNAGFATDSPTQQAYADEGELLHKRKSFRAEDPQKANKAKPAKKKKEKDIIRSTDEIQPVVIEQPRPVGKRILSVVGKVFAILLETVLLLVIALYGVMFVLAKGPSPTARDLFVMSVRETSAMYWLANLYFTDEEIAEIHQTGVVEEYEDTDTSLIQFTEPPTVDEDQGPQPDAWGHIDEDGDGIIIEQVKGDGFSGYMMIVRDPSRVIMGSVPSSFGSKGYTVEQMVNYYDAVAGTNAGGFYDPDGQGNGSIPDTMVVFEGEIYYSNKGVRDGFVGFDDNYIMHVGKLTPEQIKEKNIQYGVCFGPVLVSNGVPCDVTNSGVNPRTAIGQRSDGAVLLLVIDGRQAISLGATYQDLVDVFLEYGAVNACNLDGGSSTLMWYNGNYVNNCASVVGIRPVPTTFLVLKEGAKDNG